MEYPEDLRYSREHEWARSENGRIRVGITDFAQDALGDVVYVDLPEPGTQVTAGQAFGEVESTKSVSDVYAPVSGTIVERNAALEEKPELVNEQPYGDGWLIAIEASDQTELASASRQQWVPGARFRRLSITRRPHPPAPRPSTRASAQVEGHGGRGSRVIPPGSRGFGEAAVDPPHTLR